MSDDPISTRYLGLNHRAPRAVPCSVSTDASTLRVRKSAGRHAAINAQLPNWSSYKTWTDKARSGWEDAK